MELLSQLYRQWRARDRSYLEHNIDLERKISRAFLDIESLDAAIVWQRRLMENLSIALKREGTNRDPTQLSLTEGLLVGEMMHLMAMHVYRNRIQDDKVERELQRLQIDETPENYWLSTASTLLLSEHEHQPYLRKSLTQLVESFRRSLGETPRSLPPSPLDFLLESKPLKNFGDEPGYYFALLQSLGVSLDLAVVHLPVYNRSILSRKHFAKGDLLFSEAPWSAAAVGFGQSPRGPASCAATAFCFLCCRSQGRLKQDGKRKGGRDSYVRLDKCRACQLFYCHLCRPDPVHRSFCDPSSGNSDRSDLEGLCTPLQKVPEQNVPVVSKFDPEPLFRIATRTGSTTVDKNAIEIPKLLLKFIVSLGRALCDNDFPMTLHKIYAAMPELSHLAHSSPADRLNPSYDLRHQLDIYLAILECFGWTSEHIEFTTVSFLCNLLLTNAFTLAVSRDDAIDRNGSILALFRLASYFNHSCLPNVEMTYSHRRGKCDFRAAAAIRPGEQLFISYIEPIADVASHGIAQNLATDVRKGRKERLHTTWGFDCSCPLCFGLVSVEEIQS